MEEFKVKGIVIKADDYKDSDKLVTIFSAEKGHKISLTVWDNDGNSVTKEGTQKVEAANNKPTTIERIKEQLSKTGSTPYTVDECTVECGEGLIIPISELNSLRRHCSDLQAINWRLSERMENMKKAERTKFI